MLYHIIGEPLLFSGGADGRVRLSAAGSLGELASFAAPGGDGCDVVGGPPRHLLVARHVPILALLSDAVYTFTPGLVGKTLDSLYPS